MDVNVSSYGLVFNIHKYRKHLVQGQLTVEHIEQLTEMMKYNGVPKNEIQTEIRDEWCDVVEESKPIISDNQTLRKARKGAKR